MARWLDAADFSRGLDLLLLGLIAVIVGSYVRSLSATGVDSFTGVYEMTLVRAAAEIPAAVGTVVAAVGVLVAVGGPLLFWVVGPLYLRWDRWRDAASGWSVRVRRGTGDYRMVRRGDNALIALCRPVGMSLLDAFDSPSFRRRVAEP